MPEARIDLLRHGEAAGGPCFRGRRDDPLTPHGEAQVAAAVRDLEGWGGAPWTGVVTSPRRRCRRPAEALAAARGLPLTVDEDLAEMDFGAWEGRRAEEIQASDGARLAAFWDDPWRHPPPGGETLAAFAARVAAAWERLTARDGPLLVFTHGGVLRLLLARVLDLPRAALWRWRLDPAARLRIQPPHTLVRFEGLAP